MSLRYQMWKVAVYQRTNLGEEPKDTGTKRWERVREPFKAAEEVGDRGETLLGFPFEEVWERAAGWAEKEGAAPDPESFILRGDKFACGASADGSFGFQAFKVDWTPLRWPVY